VIAGLWVAGWIAQWVGSHWEGARPAVVFGVLRWVVAALGGLAVASLFQWWGEILSGAVGKSPLGWLDRLGGFLIGAFVGMVVTAFVVLTLLLGPWPRVVRGAAARAKVASPLMSASARACAVGELYFPGGRWLRRRFQEAGRRSAGQSRPA
jgi:hypothetical protein